MKIRATTAVKVILIFLVPVVLALLGAVAYAQVGGGFDLSWSTVDGGGGTFSTGGNYSLGGTSGQPGAGAMQNGQWSVQGGFWVAASNATPTASPTPAFVVLVGHVTWQGPPAQPSVRQQLPITLTLCVSSAPVSYGATTDPSGFFTVTTSLPTGSYNWRAKGSKYLATSGTALLTAGATTQVEMGQQKAGDTDNTHNNIVNITDFNVLKNVFGTSSATGDLNNDGVTNITDFNLLKGNFGTAGAPTNCP
jgi:hypothetical protein